MTRRLEGSSQECVFPRFFRAAGPVRITSESTSRDVFDGRLDMNFVERGRER
jgi:hypothetical protein